MKTKITIEKHVTNLELSKKMKELGFPQSSLFYWYEVEPNENFIAYHEDKPFEINVKNPIPWEEQPEYFKMSHVWKRYGKEDFTSAYLASELGEWMPEFVKTYKRSGEYWCDYLYLENPRLDEDYARTEVQSIEANAKAKMLIWLVENNYLDPKSL